MALRLYKDFSNFKPKNRNRPKVSHNSNGVWPQCGYNTNDLRCLSFYAKSRTCSFIDKYLRFLLFAKVNDIAFFRHFPKAWIDTFYCVCCIQYFSYCTSIIKHLGYMLPVSHPDIYSSRILAPCLFETLEFRFCGFQTGSTINLFQLDCKALIILIGHLSSSLSQLQ